MGGLFKMYDNQSVYESPEDAPPPPTPLPLPTITILGFSL